MAAQTLTNERFQVIKLYDPPIWINELKEYTLVQGATNSTYQTYSPSNVNNSQLSWSFTTPSPDLVMDRHLYIAYRIQLYDSNPQAVGGNPIQAPFNDLMEGPRQMPLHLATSSLSCAINGTTFSWTPDRILSAMLTYFKLEKANFGSEATCAVMGDQRAAYQNDLGAQPAAGDQALLRSQFARPDNAFNEWDSMTRNVFNWGHAVVPVNNGALAVQQALNVQIAQVEPVILPPFEFGIHSQPPGLFGVSTFTLTYNFDYNRLWSSGVFDTNAAGVAVPRVMAPGTTGTSAGGSVVTSTNLFSVDPVLFVKYYTLPASFQRPLKVSYPFYDINVYMNTDTKSIAGQVDFLPGGATGSGVVVPFSSPTILVNSIPHRIYLFGKRAISPGPLGYAFNSPAYPEVFSIITSINATINNQTGIISSADLMQIYSLCIKNGLESISFPNFTYGAYNGPGSLVFGTQPLAGGGAPAAAEQSYLRHGPGSVVCLTAADLSLSEEYVSGSLGKFSIQFNCGMCSPLTYADNWNLYTVIVSEGITSYDSNTGTWSKEIGVVSSAEVLSAPVGQPSMLKESENFYGGSIMSRLRNFGHKVAQHARHAVTVAEHELLPRVHRAIDRVEQASMGRRYASGRVRSRSRGRGGARLSRRDLLE